MQGNLTQLHSISKELSSLLMKGEAAAVFEKLEQRGAILKELQENSAGVDNQSRQNIEIETIINSIIAMDKKKLKDTQSFEEKFSTKGNKPLQPPRGWISQKHIEKRMKKLTDYNLQRFRGQR